MHGFHLAFELYTDIDNSYLLLLYASYLSGLLFAHHIAMDMGHAWQRPALSQVRN